MLKVNARAFTETTATLQRIQTDVGLALEDHPDWHTMAAPGVMKNWLLRLMDKLQVAIEPLHLPMSNAEILRLKTEFSLSTLMLADVKYYVEALERRVHEELDTILLYCVDSPNGNLIESTEPFGETVASKFPEAAQDVEEAAKCLALRRATACVLHLARAMETAVQRIADHFNIADIDREWGKLLSDIDAELKKLTDKKAREAWSEIRSSLWHVKEAWRNPSMHPNRSYTEEQAEEIFRAMRAFMRHLSSRV